MIVNFAQPAFLNPLGPPWVFHPEAEAVVAEVGDDCPLEVVQLEATGSCGTTVNILGRVDD